MNNIESEIQKIEIPNLRRDVLSLFYASEEVKEREDIQKHIAKGVELLLNGNFTEGDSILDLAARAVNAGRIIDNPEACNQSFNE